MKEKAKTYLVNKYFVLKTFVLFQYLLVKAVNGFLRGKKSAI